MPLPGLIAVALINWKKTVLPDHCVLLILRHLEGKGREVVLNLLCQLVLTTKERLDCYYTMNIRGSLPGMQRSPGLLLIIHGTL